VPVALRSCGAAVRIPWLLRAATGERVGSV
jgi:hypothetical protein